MLKSRLERRRTASKKNKNTRLNISPIGHKDIEVFSSYNMIFYFRFEGMDILYCPTKTIINPPVIIFYKGMKLTSPKNIS